MSIADDIRRVAVTWPKGERGWNTSVERSIVRAFLNQTEKRGSVVDSQTFMLLVAEAIDGAQGATTPSDRDRLDWMERQFVYVRSPLRYGSRERFNAFANCDEEEGIAPSKLRELIDKATAADGVKPCGHCDAPPGTAHSSSCPDAAQQRIKAALSKPGCERLREFYEVGPVQRAAVESFADALGVIETSDEAQQQGNGGTNG